MVIGPILSGSSELDVAFLALGAAKGLAAALVVIRLLISILAKVRPCA